MNFDQFVRATIYNNINRSLLLVTLIICSVWLIDKLPRLNMMYIQVFLIVIGPNKMQNVPRIT